MCVVSHGYVGLGGGMDGGGGWYVCGTKPGMLVACREMRGHFPSARCYTDDTRSHLHPGAQLVAWSSRNWSVFLGRRDAMRRLRFVVHAAGWLHFMVLLGRIDCCGIPQTTFFVWN